jgi:hypothetical protein
MAETRKLAAILAADVVGYSRPYGGIGRRLVQQGTDEMIA